MSSTILPNTIQDESLKPDQFNPKRLKENLRKSKFLKLEKNSLLERRKMRMRVSALDLSPPTETEPEIEESVDMKVKKLGRTASVLST